jgi:hypothetical protein
VRLEHERRDVQEIASQELAEMIEWRLSNGWLRV